MLAAPKGNAQTTNKPRLKALWSPSKLNGRLVWRAVRGFSMRKHTEHDLEVLGSSAASFVCKKISRRSEQRRTAGAKDHRRRPASVRVCGRGTAAASGAKPPRSIADCSKAKVRAAENRRLLALPVEQMKFNRNFPWNRIPQPGS